jgi:flagellar assembly protein FliH
VGGGTVVERDYDAELANVARQHAAQLNERDKEISSLRLASAQAASALAQARADAEQRGFAAGVAKGEHAGRATLTAQAEQLAEVARQVNAAHGAAIDSAEITMVEIAFAAVCRIVGDEGFGRERVRSIVRKAVAESRAREQVTVRLHPDDAALLVEGSEQPEMGPHIVADPLVRLGGCIVDSPSGTLDARFETQLTLLATALKEAREPDPQVKGVP